MDDLISRQAAINALNDEFTITGKANAITVQDYIRRVNNRLHDLPSCSPDQRWIPVSEMLPEEDKGVVISYRYKGGEGDTSHCDIDITSYGQAYFGGRACSFKEWRAPFEYFHSNYEVVAWMPLPEAYKEDTNDN